jgi:long-chain acyl-CoA synthetase
VDYQAWHSLAALFFDQAARLGDRPFLWAKRDGHYQALTWRQVAERVNRLSRGLRRLGVAPGDRVVLAAESRPEWFVADLAVLAAGAVTVPAYTTNTASDHGHVLSHSGAIGAMVSTRALADKLLPAAIEAPDCQFLISIEDLEVDQVTTVELHRWDQVESDGATQDDDVADVVARARRDDVCCFIYTSGTGGVPKGVMLSHGNLLANCWGAYRLLADYGLEREVFLSFLPLSHSYEHTAGQFFPMSIGAEIYYAEGAEHLLANLAEVRPTIMTAVPRLYESMHQRIRRGVVKQGGLKRKLFEQAVTLGRKQLDDPGGLSASEWLVNGLADRLVRSKIRQRFGGRLKAMVSGGAALNPEIGGFFAALGVPVLQGYGQTEAAPIVSANPPGRVKMATVGPPLEGVEVKIAPDGEILVRGELVMKGYWRDEAATAEAIRDGWLHTGDIGEIDGDGYLRITDRKKDILVLSGGDNLSPARIEGLLTLEPEIAQAMVHGDKRPNLVALLVPDEEFLRDWAKSQAKPRALEAVSGDPALHKALGQAVDRVNQKLSNLERVRRFLVAREAFTVDNAMMTPTLKIRRHKIQAAYGAELDALYGSAASA